jgi:MFS family permease
LFPIFTSSLSMDSAALLGAEQGEEAPPAYFSAYFTRWWVLSTFSVVAALQGATWSLPGLLASTEQQLYGIDGDTTQLLLNYGPIFYLIAAIPTAWVIDRLGIRVATLVGAILMVVSNGIRLFANDATTRSVVLLHLSFIFCAIAGPIAMAVPVKLSEDFFEPEQRTLATAVGALANQSGGFFLYLMTPVLAPGTTRLDALRMDAVLAGASAVALAMFLFRFPKRPFSAPSASASRVIAKETSMTLSTLWTATRTLARSPTYVALTAAYSVVVGLANCLSAMVATNILPLGGTQVDAAWMGTVGNGASLVVGIALAVASDLFKKRSGRTSLTPRALLVLSLLVMGASFALYAVCVQGQMQLPRREFLWLAASGYALAETCLGAFIPILFDLSAEHNFLTDTPDGLTLMFMTVAMNVVTMAFLFAPASSFFSWANYAIVPVCVLSGVMLWFVLPLTVPRFEYDITHGEGISGKEGALLQ